MKYSRWHSFLNKILLKYYFNMTSWKLGSKIWNLVFEYSVNNYEGAILSRIHGYPVLINNGYRYQINSRHFRSFNNPLLELVFQTSIEKNRPIKVIDIGAAVGDTALYLIKNSDKFIEKLYCIDGDDEFYEYLHNNLKNISKVFTIKSLLTDKSSELEAQLVRTHAGTASSQSNIAVSAYSLDTLLANIIDLDSIDVLKVDVDGLDGKVLMGAQELIEKSTPNIIFEWHPILYHQTQNEVIQPFTFLYSLGYNNFLWFDKYGKFSHFDFELCFKNINALSEICQNNLHESDWHYDIIALHKNSDIDKISLAEMKYAKNKQSRY